MENTPQEQRQYVPETQKVPESCSTETNHNGEHTSILSIVEGSCSSRVTVIISFEMDELYNSLFKEDNKDVSITVESADRGESQVR